MPPVHNPWYLVLSVAEVPTVNNRWYFVYQRQRKVRHRWLAERRSAIAVACSGWLLAGVGSNIYRKTIIDVGTYTILNDFSGVLGSSSPRIYRYEGVI